MSILAYIIIATGLEAGVSLIGRLIAIFNADQIKKAAHFVVSFAVGALLAVAFLDLLPEAIHLGEEAGIAVEGMTGIFFFVLFGVFLFFILEKFLFWYHCHDDGHCPVHTYTYLILWGDALHNLIDGVIIALAFLVDIRLGVVTTIAVLLHEIPQEMTDFSILLHGGMARRRALVYNFLVALPALCGGILTYIFADSIASILPYAIALAAGNFIYLAAVDLMPELHEQASLKHSFFQIAFLALGAFIVVLPGFFFEH